MENEYYGIDFSVMPGSTPTDYGSKEKSREQYAAVPPVMPNETVVAIAYVPYQNYKTVYEPEQGFKEGTIFPELNLPFKAGN